MKVVSSNCGCCAIKHIRDFPNSPEAPLSSFGYGHDEDLSSTSPEPYENFCRYSASSIKAGIIFKELVEEIRGRRPAGMITCNLPEYVDTEFDEEGYWDSTMVANWEPLLTEMGFKKLPPFLNSNSGNKIHHYYLIYDDGGWDVS